MVIDGDVLCIGRLQGEDRVINSIMVIKYDFPMNLLAGTISMTYKRDI